MGSFGRLAAAVGPAFLDFCVAAGSNVDEKSMPSFFKLKKQAMVTWRGMAEHSYGNVYNFTILGYLRNPHVPFYRVLATENSMKS